MVLLGSFQAARSDSILMKYTAAAGMNAYPWIMTLSVIACFGVVLTAGYMLWTIQRVYLGAERPEYKGFPEVNTRELTVLTPLAVMAILLGILPAVFVFAFTDQTVAGWYNLLKAGLASGN
jgi:NADH:ubiquinone oxidoreductase subunit 4 (subunit M)